ncbi:MAG: hypothetical protein JWO03_4101 [Bacteroidetes bacterium]|nr:hypothetical protein [Bacteroidota bacterium]
MTSKASILFLAFCTLFYSITASAQTTFPAVHAISDIIEPITLKADITHLKLTDYFKQPKQIDSITFSKGIKYLWNKKDNIITVTAQEELKPVAEMRLWVKGTAYCVVLKKALKTDKPDPGRPVINTSRLGRGSFTISVNYSRSPFSIACYWQNLKLGKGFIKRVNEEMMITIPDEAQKMKRTYIRIYANDDVSRSNDILIPLEYGEVVNDPKQIGPMYTQRYMDSVRLKEHIPANIDACEALFGDKNFDTIALWLRQSADRYGSHYSATNIKFGTDRSFMFSDPGDHSIWLHEASDDRLLMLMALAAAIPGTGLDSLALKGFSAPADKRYEVALSQLMKLRTDYIALSYGETDVAAKGDIMMIKRSYFSQTVLFVFNKSKEKQSIETGLELANFRSVFGHITSGGKVELPPLSFEVLIK